MAIIRWEPFRDLEHIFEETLPQLPLSLSSVGWNLAVDVYEDGNNVIAKMNLPGVDSKNIDISVEDDTLQVIGSRQEEQETKEKHYYSREIRRGAFERTVRLPAKVEVGKAEAEYKDGVLRVMMPKRTERAVPTTKIQIKR